MNFTCSGLPPAEQDERVAANTVFAQPTNFQMNDQVIYVAYPVSLSFFKNYVPD
jgi:hypothetical protein